MKMDKKTLSKNIAFIFLIIIAIVIIAVIIKYVFLNDNKTSKKNRYDDVKMYEEDVAKKYFQQIKGYIEENEYEQIIEIIDRDDPEYGGLSSYSLKEKLDSLGIMGKNLEIEEYQTKFVEGINNLFLFLVNDQDESGNKYLIVIKEYAPNIYTINFSGYIN